MKHTFLFAIAFSTLAVAQPDHSQKGEQTNAGQPDPSRPQFTVEDRRNEARDRWVQATERQIDVMDQRIGDLKAQRDRNAKDSGRYRQLDAKVHAVEGKMKETRDNLKSLRDADANNWKLYQGTLTRNLAELQRVSGARLAE